MTITDTYIKYRNILMAPACYDGTTSSYVFCDRMAPRVRTPIAPAAYVQIIPIEGHGDSSRRSGPPS